MIISGFQKLTLLDYPDKIAALLFTQGCNFACGYCHNPQLIPILDNEQCENPIALKDIFSFLSKRKGLLDGVVITGGEPTLHDDLSDFLAEIKKMGFLIKLDSNGSRPNVLENVFKMKLVDYVAMDLKHQHSLYKQLAKNDCKEDILASVNLIMHFGIDYEFRTTLVPGIHTEKDLHEMGLQIRGAKSWYLQNFRSQKTLDKKMHGRRSFTNQELDVFREIAGKYVKQVSVRGTL